MKKLFLIISILLLSCSITDNTSKYVNQIKECIKVGLVQKVAREFEPDVEGCICDAINAYCGTDFNTDTPRWWDNIQDWATSEVNKNKLLLLSEALIEEGKKMEDIESEELIRVGKRWINKDILKQ